MQIGDQLCRTGTNEKTNFLIDKKNAGQLVYLRVERQTLRRLPKSQAIVFTIKTYLTKIEDVCNHDSQLTQRLSSAVRNWPSEMLAYKVRVTLVYSIRYFAFHFLGCGPIQIWFTGLFRSFH